MIVNLLCAFIVCCSTNGILLHKRNIVQTRLDAVSFAQDIQLDIQTEKLLRNAIRYQNWNDAIVITKNLKLSANSGSTRTAIFIIVETCRRMNTCQSIIPLIENLSPEHIAVAREDDIMPFLNDKEVYDHSSIAFKLINYLTDKGVIFTAKAYSTLLKILPDRLSSSSSLNNLNDIKQSSSSSSSLPSRDAAIDVDTILSLCGGRKIRPDTILLNSAIDAYIRHNQLYQAVMLWKASCHKRAPFPDFLLDSFNDIYELESLSSLSSSSSSTAAITATIDNDVQRFRNSLLVYEVVGNVRTVNTILKGFRNADHGFETCLKLFRWMFTHKLQPDSITINTLVDAAVREGKLSIAENLINRSAGSGGSGGGSGAGSGSGSGGGGFNGGGGSSTVTVAAAGVEAYTSLLNGYALVKDAVSAKRVYEQMMSRGVQPNTPTYVALMAALVLGGDQSTAEQLLARSVTAHWANGGIDQDNQLSTFWNAYVTNICKLSLIQPEEVMSSSFSTTTSTDCTVDETLLTKAQLSLLKMEEFGISADIYSLNGFLQALVESDRPTKVRDAMLIFQAMQYTHPVLPDKYTYSILFTALGKAGYYNMALNLFKSATSAFGGSDNLQKPNNNAAQSSSSSSPTTTITSSAPVSSSSSTSSTSTSTTSAVVNMKSKVNCIDVTAINCLLRATATSAQPLVTVDLFFEIFNTTTTAVAVNTSVNFNNSERSLTQQPITATANTSLKYIPTVISFTITFAALINSIKNDRPPSVTGSDDWSTTRAVSLFSMMTTQNPNTMSLTRSNIPKVEEILQQSRLVYSDDGQRFYEKDITPAAIIYPSGTTTASVAAVTEVAAETTKDSASQSGSSKSSNNNTKNATKSNKKNSSSGTGSGSSTSSSGSSTSSSGSSDSSKALPLTLALPLTSKLNPLALPLPALDDWTSAAVAPPTAASSVPSRDIKIRLLYRYMRFTLSIQPDEVLVSVLRALFTANSYATKIVISKETSKLIFEDLVSLGWNPSKLPSILKSCGYSPTMSRELLRDDDSALVSRLRSSSTTNALFKKYEWNEMKSGWNPFF